MSVVDKVDHMSDGHLMSAYPLFAFAVFILIYNLNEILVAIDRVLLGEVVSAVGVFIVLLPLVADLVRD